MAPNGGGLNLDTGPNLPIVYSGPQLFTGSTSSPTFVPGNYSLGSIEYGATLNISQVALSATPEPSSIVLLGTGLLAMAWAARRRFAL